MSVVVLKVIALVFQGIEGFVFDLPPGSSPPHEVKDSTPAHPQVGDPTEVLDLIRTYLPVLIKLTRTSTFEALSGTSLTNRKRCTRPEARSCRSYEVTRPACSAAATCWNKKA